MSFATSRTFISLAASLALTGLGASAVSAQQKIVATTKPIHALVAQVMGDTGVPELLLSGTASPHTYVLKPSDAAKLASASVVFRISAAVEPFTVKATALIGKPAELVTLQEAPGIIVLPQRAGGPFETDEHDHLHGDHEQIDGHVWLDPMNAKAMVDQIAATLAARTPALAAAYRANAITAKNRIDILSADLTRQLAPVAGAPYVVFHDAYQYFEKRFGLKVVGSITVNPEIPASGRRLARLRERISKLGATCVFGEPNFDAKVIATVTEGTRARSGVLDPEGTSLPAGPDLYDSLMRNLAAELVKCLAPRA